MTRTLAALAAALIATGARAQTPPATPPPSDAPPAAAPAPAPAAPPAAAPAAKAEVKKPKGTFAIGPKSQIIIQGRAWAEVNNVRAGKGAANNGQYHNVSRLSSNSSYLRIRGERELDYGLKAIAQIEAEVSLDGSGNPEGVGPFTGTRDSFVGLDSPWGQLIFGKFDSPAKETTIGRDPFGGTGIFGYYNAFTKYRADRRLNNAIMYESPSVQGVSLLAAYAFGEQAVNSAGVRVAPYTASGAVHYRSGPLFAGVAYEYRHDCANPDKDGPTGASCNRAALSSSDGRPKGVDQVIRFGTDYTVKQTFTKVAFVFDRIMLRLDGTPTDPKQTLNRNSYWGSITQGLGTNKVQAILNYGVATRYHGTNVATKDTGAQTFTAALRYNFDSDLMAYVAVAQIRNDDGQNYKFGSGSPSDLTPAAGSNVTGYGFGLRYLF